MNPLLRLLIELPIELPIGSYSLHHGNHMHGMNAYASIELLTVLQHWLLIDVSGWSAAMQRNNHAACRPMLCGRMRERKCTSNLLLDAMGPSWK